MHIVDVNTHFGRRVSRDPRYALDTLRGLLDCHNIACALTLSMRGFAYDPRGGNDETLAAAAAHRHLLPVATLDPHDSLDWEPELTRCLRAGVRAFRFFPMAQRWSVESVLFGEIIACLCGEDIAVIVSVTEPYDDWKLIGDVARVTDESGLPVILTDAYYGNMAEVIAVAQKFPHVHVETNALATCGAIEVMVSEVGSDRLLFGSRAPERPIQKALNEILEADISDVQKEEILGRNAIRLLGISPDALAGRPEIDSLGPAVPDEDIVDVHSHLGYWRYPIPDEGYDPANMLARMARYGVTHSVLSSYESMRYDIEAGNAAIAAAIAGHPELLGYVELNPYDLDQARAEMDRYYAMPNFVGCEVELSHIPCATNSLEVKALMAEIARRGKPVLLLPGAGGAGAEAELARLHPELTIIHAHGFDRAWAETVADCPNICVEHNFSRPSHHNVRDSINVLGPERVLFGSDHNFLSLGASVGLYLDADLTPRERRLVFGANARRIFHLPA